MFQSRENTTTPSKTKPYMLTRTTALLIVVLCIHCIVLGCLLSWPAQQAQDGRTLDSVVTVLGNIFAIASSAGCLGVMVSFSQMMLGPDEIMDRTCRQTNICMRIAIATLFPPVIYHFATQWFAI